MIIEFVNNWHNWRFYSGNGWHNKLGNIWWCLFGVFSIMIRRPTQRVGGLPTTSADIVESIKDDDEREDMNPLFYGSR